MTKKVSSYRKDTRSDATFKKDIEESSLLENLLIRIYVADLCRQKKANYTIVATGCGPDGQLLSDKEVTTRCDFTLVTPSGQLRKIDIKYSRPNVSRFHLKESHLRSYIKQDTAIVMFMGIETENVTYTVIRPKEQEQLLKTGQKVSLWGKDQIRCLVSDFTWRSV